ncbi:hypothetical protein SanaruYs_00510 [Chryseotalea sanaruensis]|uniref:Uncharacterized protein n=1 Tax=Chryseotalea sanaruensis TaxID=2482724 RepID=A0A401U4K9_9BACT|nr:hypothetical protein [Chryseotalea sanaruensis]GCC49837.1 hypothetical protein SanaruYs_00510 [Chryseotalea sanaruensis]
MDEKERKELEDFFKKNPKVQKLANETRQTLHDLDRAIEDAPPDRPAPRLTPNGALSHSSPGTQTRTKGILIGMKKEALDTYHKKLDEFTINYDEATKGRIQELSTKSILETDYKKKEYQTNKENLKYEFSESKSDIQRGDVSKRIMDSLWSSRVGKGIDPEQSKDKLERNKLDKDRDLEPIKD